MMVGSLLMHQSSEVPKFEPFGAAIIALIAVAAAGENPNPPAFRPTAP
jgi:hypothetical protein